MTLFGLDDIGSLFSSATDQITQIQGATDVLSTVFANAGVSTEKLASANIVLSGTTSTLSVAQLDTLVSTGALDDATRAQIVSTYGLSAAQKKAAITSKLLQAALNAGVILAVSLAIKAVTAAWNKFNVTVKESQEKIDDVNSTISDLKSEIENLEDVKYKTDKQEEYLAGLKLELEYQEKLLEIEQKRLLQEKYGSGFTDYFDEDNDYTALLHETSRSNRDGYKGIESRFNTNSSKLSKLNSQIAEQERLKKIYEESGDSFSAEYHESIIIDLIEKKNKLLKDQQSIEDDLQSKQIEYYKKYTEAKEAVASGLLYGQDLENAKYVMNEYEQLYNNTTGMLNDIRTNHTEAIDNIFKQDRFKNDKSELIALGKDGSLSIEEISAKFPELINELALANLEASDLYNYIMNIADADISDADTTASIQTISNQLSKIQELSLGLDQLDEIMADIVDGKDFDYSSILNNDDFTEAFGKYKEEYENFIEVVANSPRDISKCKTAFNELATAYVYGSGVLADLTEESKNAAILELRQMGIANATEIVNNALGRYSESLEVASKYSFDLEEQSLETLSTLAKERQIVGEDAEALFYYAMQKQLCSETGLSTAEDCAQLIALAEQAKLTGEIINKLRIALSIFSGGGAVTWGEATKELARKEIEKAFAELSNTDVKFGGGTKTKEAGEKAADEYIKAFEKELESLKILRERGDISEKEYLDRLKVLYEKYFKDRKQYLDEFKKYETEYLEGMKSLYDSALSGISKLFDKQIEGYQKQKEAIEESYQLQIDSIKDQIDGIEDLIDKKNDQIDAINDEIDKINEAAEARKRELDLQKAQYELERMQNQRVGLVYQDGQMVYRPDEAGIRDAREEIQSIQEEMQIAELEKQISLIEKEIELLEDQKSSLEKQQEAIQKMLEASNKYYDSLIKQLEKQKSKWEEIAEIEEIANAYAAIEQVFGDLGYSVEDVLNGSAGAFEDFKSKYISIINDMNSNTNFKDGLSRATGVAKDELGSFLDQTKELSDGLSEIGADTTGLDNLSTKFGEVGDSVGEVSNAINGSGGTSTSSKNAEEGDKSQSGGSSLKDAIDDQTSDATEKINTQKELFAGEEDSLVSAVQEVIEKVAGGSDDESSKSGSGGKDKKDEADATNLKGAIQAQYDTANEVLPAEKTLFDNLKTSIQNCVTELNNMITALETIAGLENGGHVSASGLIHGGGGISISGRSKGGLITKKDSSPLDYMAKAIGEDHMVALEEGEIVINKKQAKSVMDGIKANDAKDFIVSDYNSSLTALQNSFVRKAKQSSGVSNSSQNDASINIGDVSFTCTGVTGEQVLHQIEGQFEGLFLDAYQRSMRRK